MVTHSTTKKIKKQVQEVSNKKIVIEDLSTGNISYRIYMTYISHGAHWFILLVSFAFSISLNASNVFNDVYLAKWLEDLILIDNLHWRIYIYIYIYIVSFK